METLEVNVNTVKSSNGTLNSSISEFQTNSKKYELGFSCGDDKIQRMLESYNQEI